MNSGFVTGTFIKEEKNRFLCIVRINDVEEECYIPSSCRLENFLSLNGKKVLLKKNKNNKGRTRYSVFAIKYKRSYLILKPAEANEIICKALINKRFGFVDCLGKVEKECTFNGYKADFYLPETKQIIEVKSIITVNSIAVFPSVYSERAINQLNKLLELMNSGYEVLYFYVSLNPFVKQVLISSDTANGAYNKLLCACIEKGMVCKAFTAEMKDGQTQIKREIPILFS